MKKIFYIVSAIVLTGALASCAPRGGDRTSEMIEKIELGEIPDEVDVFMVNTTESRVAWEGKKITGSGHHGVIAIKSGELYSYDGTLIGGQFVLDMTRITVLDIEDSGSNARLKGHLESDDFFSVATYPESQLEIAGFEPIDGAAAGAPNYRISGNLTIKGITHGITFDAIINQQDEKVHAKSAFDFDRSKYDVRFGSGRFFENLGDNLILDAINLDVDLVASK
jgi:polyisoprenoid-binding protein YceI